MNYSEYPVTNSQERDIERRFSTLRLTICQEERMHGLRVSFRDLAETLIRTTPLSREQSVAITKLEESFQWAIAALGNEG